MFSGPKFSVLEEGRPAPLLLLKVSVCCEGLGCCNGLGLLRRFRIAAKGLEPFFKGAAGSCSLSTDEFRLIEGLLKSRPDTFVTTELVQLVREVTGRGDDLRPAAVYAAVKKAGITRKRAAHAASQQGPAVGGLAAPPPLLLSLDASLSPPLMD